MEVKLKQRALNRSYPATKGRKRGGAYAQYVEFDCQKRHVLRWWKIKELRGPEGEDVPRARVMVVPFHCCEGSSSRSRSAEASYRGSKRWKVVSGS